MLQKVSTVLECSRAFSLPMTVLSWLVVFTFGLMIILLSLLDHALSTANVLVDGTRKVLGI